MGVHCIIIYSCSFYAGEDVGDQAFLYLIDGSVSSIKLFMVLRGHLKLLFLFFSYS